MINISNFTSKDNPQWQPGDARGISGDNARGAWGDEQTPRERGDPLGFPPMGYTLLSWVAYALRRHGDRWFAMADNEAYWRGWQITKTRAGLGRCYRDPRFDTLAACTRCAGAGVYADAPCGPCQGTGRITLGEVS